MKGEKLAMSQPLRTVFVRILVCFLFVVGSVYAQSTTATLTGIVSDSSGAVVPKTDITLTSASTGEEKP